MVSFSPPIGIAIDICLTQRSRFVLQLPPGGLTRRVSRDRLELHERASQALLVRREIMPLDTASVFPVLAVEEGKRMLWFTGADTLASGTGEVSVLAYCGRHRPSPEMVERLAWTAAIWPGDVRNGATAARWLDAINRMMPPILRLEIFSTDHLTLAEAERLTGISRRTIARHRAKAIRT